MQTIDTNSAYFAKFCFKLGIALKRIEVIADDEDEIIEAARRMSKNYDFVVTSGGIGPTWVADNPKRWSREADERQARRYHLPIDSQSLRAAATTA